MQKSEILETLKHIWCWMAKIFCSKIQLTSQATTYLSFAPDRILNLLKFFCGRSFKFAFKHPINNALKLAFRAQVCKFPRKRSRFQNISPWYCQDLNLGYLLVSSNDNMKFWGDSKWNFQFCFSFFLSSNVASSTRADHVLWRECWNYLI